MPEPPPPTQTRIDSQRQALLEQIQAMIETPMIILAFIWLALFVIEVIHGLIPFLEIAGYIIWALFILEFALGLWLAPRKLTYLKHNWLKAMALVAPALRILRILYILRLARLARLARLSRAASLTRGLRLLRVLSSINRGMRALGRTMSRRGFGYVVVLTVIVTFVGAAGMYTFENNARDNSPRAPTPGNAAEPSTDDPGAGFDSYGEALWWTAMIMTTMGSQYWPQTAAGRFLCVLLALYSFTVFGYVTAVLATFFIDRDADSDESEVAGAKQLESLREEIAALREQLKRGPEREK